MSQDISTQTYALFDLSKMMKNDRFSPYMKQKKQTFRIEIQKNAISRYVFFFQDGGKTSIISDINVMFNINKI